VPEMHKVALILGVTGQDGCYLARLLLEKGYEVIGVSRGKSEYGLRGLVTLGVVDQVRLKLFDAQQIDDLKACINDTRPVEIYNLAGESSVAESFTKPKQIIDSTIKISVNCLEIIRNDFPETRYYCSASSDCFGDTGQTLADETSPFRPVSPYGVAKAACHYLTQVYRKTYGLFACSGIVFNHESPLRPSVFVTQKIVAAAHAIARGEQEILELGDLSIERDWGWAPDYVDAMHRILQIDAADDFVIATGRSITLRQLVQIVFEQFDLDWNKYVHSSETLRRPTEIQRSRGSAKKALNQLGWSATKNIEETVTELIKHKL